MISLSRTLSCILVAGLLAGCGSGAGTQRSSAAELKPRRAVQTGGDYTLDLPAEEGVYTVEIAGTPAAVIDQVTKVYEELGIPIGMLQTSTYSVGNTDFKARRQIGKIAMTRIVDCGHGVTGPRAQSDNITFDLRTQVKAISADRVVLETRLSAIAQSTQGTSSNVVSCSTKGELERQIAARVSQRISS